MSKIDEIIHNNTPLMYSEDKEKLRQEVNKWHNEEVNKKLDELEKEIGYTNRCGYMEEVGYNYIKQKIAELRGKK